MGNNTSIKAQLKEVLRSADYPCKKADIVEKGRSMQSGERILFLLDKLPDKFYGSFREAYEDLDNFI